MVNTLADRFSLLGDGVKNVRTFEVIIISMKTAMLILFSLLKIFEMYSWILDIFISYSFQDIRLFYS